MSDWAEPYLGLPWIEGQCECWQFAARVWAEVFGWAVDPAPLAGDDPRLARRLCEGHAERGAWDRTDAPRDGDAVMMARGARPCHVGVWAGPGSVLHSVRGAGGLLTPIARLPDLGYRVVALYRRRAA